jgi:hypothetical protein
MAVNKRPSFGGIFSRGHISLKTGHIAPFLATIQALSKTRVFLYTQKKSWTLCMGRTSRAIKARTYLLNKENSWKIRGVSWESNPARVKASGRGAKCYPRG